MEKTEIHTVEMVRTIRDQMYEETKEMTREEFLDYIHGEAAPLLRDDSGAAPDSARPAA
jgi:hypothetical protein